LPSKLAGFFSRITFGALCQLGSLYVVANQSESRPSLQPHEKQKHGLNWIIQLRVFVMYSVQKLVTIVSDPHGCPSATVADSDSTEGRLKPGSLLYFCNTFEALAVFVH